MFVLTLRYANIHLKDVKLTFLFDLLVFTGDLNLNVVAMALSGYTDEKSSLWREMCSSLRLQLKNPYLCVMFAFLTSEPGSYDGVLVPDFLPGWNFMGFITNKRSDGETPLFT